MSKNVNDKYLLVVSFLEGRNFPKLNKTKLIIEAKFDAEQLTTDPVEHNEIIEVNQELAWELDKKSLQMHKLQRSCIKAICYAVKESTAISESSTSTLILIPRVVNGCTRRAITWKRVSPPA